jgi:hypothetical protein
VAECPNANPETSSKALELRKELLTFSKWIVPHKIMEQVAAEEEALRNENFLYAEQM